MSQTNPQSFECPCGRSSWPGAWLLMNEAGRSIPLPWPSYCPLCTMTPGPTSCPLSPAWCPRDEVRSLFSHHITPECQLFQPNLTGAGLSAPVTSADDLKEPGQPQDPGLRAAAERHSTNTCLRFQSIKPLGVFELHMVYLIAHTGRLPCGPPPPPPVPPQQTQWQHHHWLHTHTSQVMLNSSFHPQPIRFLVWDISPLTTLSLYLHPTPTFIQPFICPWGPWSLPSSSCRGKALGSLQDWRGRLKSWSGYSDPLSPNRLPCKMKMMTIMHPHHRANVRFKWDNMQNHFI